MGKKLKSEILMDANDVNDNKHKWMIIYHKVHLFFLNIFTNFLLVYSPVLNLNLDFPNNRDKNQTIAL